MSCPSELWNTVLTPVLLSFPQVQSRLFPKLSMFLHVGGKLDIFFFVQNFVLSRTVWATIEVEKQNSKLTRGYWKKKSSSSFHCSLLCFGSGLPVWLRDIDVLVCSRPLCGSGDAETISRILSTPIWVLIITLESSLTPGSGFHPPSSDRAAFYLRLRLVVISPSFSFSSQASPQFHEIQLNTFYTISEGFGLKKKNSVRKV